MERIYSLRNKPATPSLQAWAWALLRDARYTGCRLCYRRSRASASLRSRNGRRRRSSPLRSIRSNALEECVPALARKRSSSNHDSRPPGLTTAASPMYVPGSTPSDCSTATQTGTLIARSNGRPPESATPRICAAASEHRNTTAAPICSGVASLSNLIFAASGRSLDHRQIVDLLLH